MRLLPVFITIAIISCHSHPPQEKPSEELLHNYSRQSDRTDPGDFASMYDGLPHSYDSLNRIIKCLLIHPLEARQQNMKMEELSYDGIAVNTEKLLELMVNQGHTELDCPVDAGNRLVLACFHHAMLLTSILRNQGIPVRMRAGFSRFYEKEYGIRFGHIICEVWDADKEKWILVDPDRGIVNMSENDFDYAYQAWDNIRKNKKQPGIYTSSISAGVKGIINLMILDASLILKEERVYWDLPGIVLQEIKQLEDLDTDMLSTLEQLSHFCSTPDVSFEELSEVYYGTKGFEPSGLDYESYFQMLMDTR